MRIEKSQSVEVGKRYRLFRHAKELNKDYKSYERNIPYR